MEADLGASQFAIFCLARLNSARLAHFEHFHTQDSSQYQNILASSSVSHGESKRIQLPASSIVGCLLEIRSDYLCAEWPASTFHGPRQGTCGEAECTAGVGLVASRQVGQQRRLQTTLRRLRPASDWICSATGGSWCTIVTFFEKKCLAWILCDCV